MWWRFKDQSMSFDLGKDFVFDKNLARALIENQSPIRPLPEHFFIRPSVFSWSHGDRDWPVIRRKSDHQGEGEVPLMKRVAPSAQEIRPVVPQDAAKQTATETTSSVPQGTHDRTAMDTTSSLPTSSKRVVGSSGSQLVRNQS
ncbi:hypothetical protein Hdeb2414_s0003g00105751 [Helianthus debilis subsp. tardiflorus]